MRGERWRLTPLSLSNRIFVTRTADGRAVVVAILDAHADAKQVANLATKLATSREDLAAERAVQLMQMPLPTFEK